MWTCIKWIQDNLKILQSQPSEFNPFGKKRLILVEGKGGKLWDRIWSKEVNWVIVELAMQERDVPFDEHFVLIALCNQMVVWVLTNEKY